MSDKVVFVLGARLHNPEAPQIVTLNRQIQAAEADAAWIEAAEGEISECQATFIRTLKERRDYLIYGNAFRK